MKNISYAVYDSDVQTGGIYNVLASFERGILKGFKDANLNVCNFSDCKELPDVVIGFNLFGLENWEKVLNSHKTINVMWSVDSVFSNNFSIINHVSECKNYVQLGVTKADMESIKIFMPKLQYIYLPHATDLSLWKKDDNAEKENDVVFFATIRDYDADLQQLKDSCKNQNVYSLIIEIIDFLLKNPNNTFWQIYNMLKTNYNIQFTPGEYNFMYNFLTTYVEQAQKIKMIQALSNTNIKIYGNNLWEKYIKGNIEYMGVANLEDSIKIMNKSKISLHCHPVKLNEGLHERFLNAGAVETFNLISDTPYIKENFGDSFGYFNHSTFEDIEEKVNYYLRNEEERIFKAKQAYEIIKNNHTWKHRAIAIDSIFEKP